MRLIAVGDIHGELEGFQLVLRLENLIDDKNQWCGKDGDALIQIGDMIDRGPHSRESVKFIRDLQKQAEKSEGRVIRLFGNHELMALQGYFSYCDFETPEELAEEIREEILQGKIQTAFAYEKRLYVHAGIRLRLLERIKNELNLGQTPWDETYELITEYLNRTAHEGISKKDYSHPIFWVDASRGGRDEVGGVFWAHYPDLACEGVNPLRQVVGHTPPDKKTRDSVRWTRDGKNINIDVGFYSGYGGNRGWLAVNEKGVWSKIFWKDKIFETKIADK